MENFEIVQDHSNIENPAVAFNKSQIEKIYKQTPLQVNVFHYLKDSGFPIQSSGKGDAVKTYYILKGMCKNLETNTVLMPGDIVIVREIDEFLTLYMLEDTDILVHSVNFNSFEEVKNSATYISDILAEIQDKDTYTEQHCSRVFELVYKMVLRLGYNGTQMYNILRAARYHDIGKIYIQDNLLTKPAKLTDSEYDIMKEHAVLGKELVLDCFNDEIFDIISEHHERIDGSGYPKGLVGEEISEEGKIMAICDSFDAMTTDRVYQPSKSIEEVIKELQDLSGIKYDKRLVDIFIETLHK